MGRQEILMAKQAPNAAVMAAIQSNKPEPPKDKLDALRKMVGEARDKEALKADLESRLKETNIRLQELYHKDLPDLLDQVGVPSISLAAEGNLPAVTAKAEPYYRANIAAEWEPDRKQAAFSLLDSLESGDIIKSDVTVQFSRGQREQTLALTEQLKTLGFSPIVKDQVPWATLTSWLKEQVERHDVTFTAQQLETLGATIGRIVRLK